MDDLAGVTSPLSILIVDDEINIRKTLSICLEAEGHRVVAVSNTEDALVEASRKTFELAFVDIRLGTSDGLDLIPMLLSQAPWLKVIVITAFASIETAVEAMRRGATDYIPKPFTPAQVGLAVKKTFQLQNLEQRLAALQDDLGRTSPEIDFSRASPAMERALDLARQAAPTDATILLRGESGTGKSVLARMIHSWSARAAKPMSIVSCPAFSSELLESELFGHVKGAFTGAVRDNPGRISACEGGTLLLDEIGDLSPSLQPKLLRFIQEREYERVGDSVTRRADVRIIAATNTNLEKAVQEGRFREDLFFRLNVIPIEVPPLRERHEDIVPLAEKMLLFFGRKYHRSFAGFTEEAREVLGTYPWPGNVRELRNVAERAAILCRSPHVGAEHLPGTVLPRESITRIGDHVALDKVEEQHVRRILAATKSLQEAADVLGIDQATLWRKRKKYGI
jgi:NtrC-family two-component system response regulator AlgB